MSFGAQPSLTQFLLVEFGPFYRERKGSSGQLTLNQLQRFNRKKSLSVVVHDVNVRRCVVVIVHPNHNSVEHAESGHAQCFGRQSAALRKSERVPHGILTGVRRAYALFIVSVEYGRAFWCPIELYSA